MWCAEVKQKIDLLSVKTSSYKVMDSKVTAGGFMSKKLPNGEYFKTFNLIQLSNIPQIKNMCHKPNDKFMALEVQVNYVGSTINTSPVYVIPIK